MAEDILVTQKSQKAQKKVQNEGECEFLTLKT